MTRSILLVGNHPPPYGGVPMHIRYLAPYLVESGWDVHVLSFAGSPTRGADVVEELEGYRVYRPAKWQKWRSALLRDVESLVANRSKSFALQDPVEFLAAVGNAGLIRRIAERNRVDLISAYHVMAGLPAAWVSEAFGIPLVTTIFGEVFARPDFYRRRQREVKYLCDVSKRLLSCSRHCAGSLRAIGLPHKVEAIYYGVDTGRFNPENDGLRIRLELGIAAEDSVVAFVGRMESELGLDILFRAIPRVLQVNKDARFIIAGRAGALTGGAIRLSQRLPRSVFVLTDIPPDDLPFFYAAASLVVVPSVNARACLGLAIAEAMASGKPVIVADSGGGREVIGDEGAGTVIPAAEPAALARAITEMLGDPEGMRAAGEVGRRRAQKYFDKNTTNRTVEGVFREVVR